MTDADTTASAERWIAEELPWLTDLRPLARGGFGVVYTARQPSLNRTVAVKVLTAPVLDDTARLRFERECKAMGMLSDHPNILTLFEAGFTPTGRPYLVMELMSGGCLRDVLDREPLPWEQVLDTAVRVAAALETAHRAGILHRDIKPENIMLSDYGEPQLGDFGIARLHGGPETRTDSLTASIAHVSPELLSGQKPSRASDVYALGSTLYMLLSGEAAHLRRGEESIVPALSRIAHDPVPDLRPRGVPDAVAAYVERLMSKDPAGRPASAEQAALEAQQLQQRLGLPATPIRIPDLPEELDARSTDDPLQDSLTLGAPTEGGPTVVPRRQGGSANRPSDSTVVLDATPGATADRAAAHLRGPQPGVTAPAGAVAHTVSTVDVGPPTPGAVAEPGAPPATPSSSRKFPLVPALAIGLIVVGVVAFLVLRPGTREPAATPAPSAVAAATQSAATPAGTAAPGSDATTAPPATTTPSTDAGGALALDATAIAAQLEDVRGLPVPADLRAEAVPTAAFLDDVAGFAVTREGDLALEDRLLTALHVLPAETDLPQLWQDLAAEQYLGYYDHEQHLVRVRADDAELSELERSILADEVVAAEIDEAYGLDALLARDDHDAANARLSLVRGDQFLTSNGWVERFMTQAEQSALSADFGLLPDTVGRTAPPPVRQRLVFPFVAGSAFVNSLLVADPDPAVAFAGVDAAYADPPSTTEQVLHPERYQAREPAVPVTVGAAPGEGWEPLADRTFGELDLVQLLLPLDAAPVAAGQAGRVDTLADGWGGGRLSAWTRGEETAVAVWLTFDDPAEAAEVCQALPEWYATVSGAPAEAVDGVQTGPSDAFAVACSGADVHLALAPDATQAAALR